MLINHLYALARPLLFTLDAERSHEITMNLLQWAERSGVLAALMPTTIDDPVDVMGLHFPNRVGLAAGLDKDARYLDALGALGFGFLEVGTVTPRPQPGNPQPRLFRLRGHDAIINRMGFNNAGVDALVGRVEASRRPGVLGINIGKNAATPMENAVQDYLAALRKVHRVADYVTINVSSPNTTGLRDLQAAEVLRDLCGRLRAEQMGLQSIYGRYVPLVLKLAPDMTDDELRASADVAMATGMDGLIVTNTTVSRPAVIPLALAGEEGGLSGAPLRERSLQVLELLSGHCGRKIPLISSGGIMSAADARARLAAGAQLVQLYSGLIYRGPGLVREVAEALAEGNPQQ